MGGDRAIACPVLQEGFQVDIFLQWSRKLHAIGNSSQGLNVTTADTADILSRVQVHTVCRLTT